MAVIDSTGQRAHLDRLERVWAERKGLLGWLTTTDHKKIGILYFFTAIAFFGAGGVEALLIRTQLIGPDQTLLSPQAYDEVFTLHGVTMIFLFVIPISMGAFGNYLLPLMIGARDMAFPRMNALSYWIYVASGLFVYTGLAIGQAPDAGWFNYVPLASRQFAPGAGIDFYALGLIFNGVSTTAAAINFIVTIFKLRAPGMSLNRMPLFCYAFLAVSFAVVFALPPLSTACILLELDRRLGFDFYNVAAGASRCCGSTCSGSSAIPRSTSSSCPRSGSRRRSSRPSRGAGWWRSRSSPCPRSSSPSSASGSGSTTCSRRGLRW